MTVRYWHTEWNQKASSQGAYRTADLNLKLAHAVLLRIICGGNLHIPVLVKFFTTLADFQLNDVTKYIAAFLTAVDEHCDVNNIELPVKPSKRGGAFDFPRPPAGGMFLRQFCNNVAQHSLLAESVLTEGVSLRNLTVRRVRKTVAEEEAEKLAATSYMQQQSMTRQLARMFFFRD